ncbi:Rne/Rng family ribonuclease [Kocuria sp.]|uniref:Rne/Rng family ribonuclease n=1 Tax=Kocuria sp. TaxID=1871328 RepID=UPI0026E02331|nr:Rne/Rng family ribonuclease [Kocuria sp.]MDO5619406.1 Rne/Rng family ribonuclease [Kocuria sp.]
MTTEQVNPAQEGSASTQAVTGQPAAQTPAETAYQALQAAEAGSTTLPPAEDPDPQTPAQTTEDDDAPVTSQEQTELPLGSTVAPSESSSPSESEKPTDSDAPSSVAAEGTEQNGSDEHTTQDTPEEPDSQESPAADPFADFSSASATSLMFHAPDTEAIQAAAERAAQAREEARQAAIEEAEAAEEAEFDDPAPGTGVTSKRRRRRRRGSVDMELEGGNDDDPPGTVTRIRTGRVVDSAAPTTVQSVKGSTRLEAKKQRRRESRQSGRRRQVITEAEFLARRESVERKMVVREKDDRIQIGVLEDGVLAEHFVSHTQQDSLIGNVYLGKVQNVLPSMEAAFIDIGRGRNAVLYAGEVNWDDAELGGSAKRIENALKSGDSVLVQVTKDPVGHKGARLTSQVSLPGRYLVYVPGGSMTGISRKLPDVERQRLKKILKDHLPDGAGVIVRTAAEGASEQELTNDINRLRSQWEQIQEKAGKGKTLAPELLYAEPDLTIKTVRDVFNEDFTSMTVQGQAAWDNIEAYVMYVAPDLLDRVTQWTEDEDLFEHFQVDEQIYKALDRKVMLPSGGSLVIDRTEAMTVVDVNTGKFTGSGGNLEETVTKNNLEAAEEIVRQLRLRDIGGIIVIDFIDMVLEANRDLVLRRLVECLGRDRTKHQVAEVTSLGLVQMTRKRMGTGLLEIFSEPCEACDSRGVVIHDHPLKGKGGISTDTSRRDRNERKRNRRGGGQEHSTAHHSNQANGSDSGSGNGSDSGSSAGAGSGSGLGLVEDPEQAKRAQATRNAFAAIASASQHDDAPATSAASEDSADATDSTEQKERSGGGRGRSRGSRRGGRGRDNHAGRASQEVAETDANQEGENPSGSAAENERAVSGQSADAHSHHVEDQDSSTADGPSQGEDSNQDSGREGNKRRRKRRGKRSRNRGQNDSETSETQDHTGENQGRAAAAQGRNQTQHRPGVSDDAPGASDTAGALSQSITSQPSTGSASATSAGAPDSVASGAEATPRRRTRGARRAAAPVGTPDAAAAPQNQGATVTSGTAVAVTGARADQSKVTINGQVIDLPHGAGGAESADGAAAGANGVPSLDSLADSLGERGPEQPPVRKPRRSRRASAPAAAPKPE